MNRLNLEIVRGTASTRCLFEVRRVVNAGYVGRDEAAVRRHIEELRHEGVGAPPSVPMFFPVVSTNVTTADRIETIEQKTSGEVEYVLLLREEEILVGIGSDHTDRRLEAIDMIKSKQACPNVMGRTVWAFEEVRGHWDELVMQSWVRVKPEAEWVPYQSAPLAAILPASQIIELVRARLADGEMEGAVIFSGTIPVLDGNVSYGSGFRCALVDPVRQRTLECTYNIALLDYFDSVSPVTTS